MKINPFSIYAIAAVSQIIIESMQKKKTKSQLTKFILKQKNLDFKNMKNLYFLEIFQKLVENS